MEVICDRVAHIINLRKKTFECLASHCRVLRLCCTLFPISQLCFQQQHRGVFHPKLQKPHREAAELWIFTRPPSWESLFCWAASWETSIHRDNDENFHPSPNVSHIRVRGSLCKTFVSGRRFSKLRVKKLTPSPQTWIGKLLSFHFIKRVYSMSTLRYHNDSKTSSTERHHCDSPRQRQVKDIRLVFLTEVEVFLQMRVFLQKCKTAAVVRERRLTWEKLRSEWRRNEIFKDGGEKTKT